MLALDIAGTTGWAYRNPTGRQPPISGAFAAGWEGCHDTQFFRSFDKWIDDRLGLLKPIAVVLEAPILLPRDKLATVRRIYGAIGIAEAAAARHGLVGNVYEFSNQSIKTHATGDRWASKDDMMDKATSLGWEFVDDNACDALWLLDLALSNHEEATH